MNKQEAKIVLHALRPSDLATADPVFAEALALMERDPELKSWWKTQQAFDRAIAAKLKRVPIPDDLRATILAGRKIEQFRPSHSQFYSWLAVAAAVGIFCALGTTQYLNKYGPFPRSEYTAAILPLINNDAPSLAVASQDRDKIMSWLKQRNAPMGSLPEKMTEMPTIGCQKYSVHGHNVSLICFAMANGAIVHLFMIEEAALTDPPGTDGPAMWQSDKWSTASWSDGRMTYVLATQAGPDVLKQLL